MNSNYNPQQKNKNAVGAPFFVLIISTIILLLAVVISLFVVISKDNADNIDKGKDTLSSLEENNPNDSLTADTSSIPTNVNNTPLFPTNVSRSSYVIGQASDVKTIDTTKVKSQHSILVDLSTYQSVAEKAADTKIYPASMTKVMTLIVACERVTDLNKKLTVTEELASYASENEGSGVGLKVGESYTVEDLLYLISYQSDTIASLLIANDIAGNEKAFVDLMNNKAKELGLTSTSFANCTGLYNDNNYTTCREMASIMAYALENEMAYKCLTSYTGRPMTVGGQSCIFYSGWYSGRFNDNPRFTGGKVIAGKTGYTDESGYTLVSCAEIDGNKYINVIVTRTNKESGVKVQEDPSAEEVKYIYKTYK